MRGCESDRRDPTATCGRRSHRALISILLFQLACFGLGTVSHARAFNFGAFGVHFMGVFSCVIYHLVCNAKVRALLR